MTQEWIVEQTQEIVKNKFKDETTGHDWWHIYRVWKNSIHLAELESANRFVTELAALLHDIADWKFNNGDLEAGSREARKILESLNVDQDTIAHVCEIVQHVSFKGAGVKNHIKTLEGKIVQDADRLDAIGAIGIARAFTYGGSSNQIMHDPQVVPVLHQNFEAYKNKQSTTINHFYEKLLLLKDLMNTDSAKKIAEQRHVFMQGYLDRLMQEWEGKL